MIFLDVLYIGLPFSRWDYRKMTLQRHRDLVVAQAFIDAGCSVFAVNASEDGDKLCAENGWSSLFVQQSGVIPTDFFLAANVFWEDYLLLYISSTAVFSSPEYMRFVNRAAEEAVGNGLVVVADIRGEAAKACWADKVSVVWDIAPASPALHRNGLISIGIGLQDIVVFTRKGVGRFPGTVDGEQFVPVFLKSLMEGKSMADSVASYVHT